MALTGLSGQQRTQDSGPSVSSSRETSAGVAASVALRSLSMESLMLLTLLLTWLVGFLFLEPGGLPLFFGGSAASDLPLLLDFLF